MNPKIESLNSKIESLNPKIESLNPKIKILNPKIESLNPKIESLNPKRESLNPKIYINYRSVHIFRKVTKHTSKKSPKLYFLTTAQVMKNKTYAYRWVHHQDQYQFVYKFENIIVRALGNSQVTKFCNRYVDDTLLLIRLAIKT